MAHKSAGQNVLANTTALIIFDSATKTEANGGLGPCAAATVKNSKDSAGNLKVTVDGIHESGDFDVLEPGDFGSYRLGYNGITKITVQAVSTATVNHSVTARSPATRV